MSPIFRQNIYVGVFEKYKHYYSPLDFFNVDYKRYPHAKNVKFLDVTVESGDCIYIPAYYFWQTETLTNDPITSSRYPHP